MDDPLLELLREPRMLHHRDTEASWFRLVDVQQALSQRGYGGPADIVIEIEDDNLAPWNTGKWRLQADETAAEANSTTESANARMNVKTLASLFTGTRRATDLYHWGLLEAGKADLAMLDRLFATTYAPHCPDHY